MQKEKQTYVLDTSALINKPTLIHSLPGSNIVLAIEVLEELDRLKVKDGKIGISARYVNRYLDKIRKDGDFRNGVQIENDQIIAISFDSNTLKYKLEDTNDNRIISVAKKLKDDGFTDVTILTRDISFRIKANSLQIEAEDSDTKDSFSLELYKGSRIIEAPLVAIDNLYRDGVLTIKRANFVSNEGVIVKNEESKSSCLGVALNEDTVRKTQYTSDRNFNIAGLKPRSAEQYFACEYLLNPSIDLVTISGMAGSGKTLLAVAAAIEQLHSGVYRKLVISRPAQSLSKDIGFLPGTLEEKMAPWVQPIFDNIEFIYSKNGKNYINNLIQKGDIDIVSLSHIRGRSLPGTIFIVDEAQNINYHEAKALLTRMGEESKLILTGDLEQIDTPNLTTLNSGLSAIVNIFKEYHGAAHVTLTKGERSPLATYAAINM